MLTKDLFVSELDDTIKRKYIEYYFENIVGFDGDVSFEQSDRSNLYSVLVLKDKIGRGDKRIGTGAYRQKPYSVFFFSFIDGIKYVESFGTNGKYRRILGAFDANDFENYELTGYVISETKSKLNKFYKSKGINYFIQNYIFSDLYSNYRPLFSNSYIYSIYCIVDENDEIDRANFNTYYFNSKYKFCENTYPKVIKQNKKLDDTSYIVINPNTQITQIYNNSKELDNLVYAYTGKLDLTYETQQNFDSIIKSIESGDRFIITEGMARTGKTVIAMRLLNKYPESTLLLMNYLFYKSLKKRFQALDVVFPENRIFHHDPRKKDDGFWGFGKNIDMRFIIVDEAQRLGDYYSYNSSTNEIDQIVNCFNQKHAIFLGDNYQKLNPKYDKGIVKIENTLITKGYDYKKFLFTHSIGMPSNIINSIKYLLYNDNYINSCKLENYEVNVYYDVENFIKAYKTDNAVLKHMATVYLEGAVGNDLPGYTIFNYGKFPQIEYFLDDQIKAHNILVPYALISRELDSIYIYLPKSIKTDGKSIYIDHILNPNNEYLLNQLYVLMTRAKLSINICCQNYDVCNYFIKKLDNLKRKEREELQKIDPLEKAKANDLETKIKVRGITRLIHFTCEKNINSILRNGILPVNELKLRDIEYDHNDYYRFDDQLDAISLSIQNPNLYLLRKYKERYPNKRYKILIIDPAVLYDNFVDGRLVEQLYCNYNAAAKNTKKSNDFESIFQEDNSYFWFETRYNKEDNEPTSDQAEILYFGGIPSKYIIDIRNCD